MRKLKTFIYFFITFIFLSSPIDAKASSVALTTESLQLLHDGIDFLSYSGSIPYGFLPYVFSSEKDFQSVYEDMFSKQDVFTINGQPNIRQLTTDEYSLLQNATIYDDDGNIVTLQELYYGEIDNGYFTEKFYCKNDGSIVYQDSSKDNPYIDVKFGGSEFSYIDWENSYDELSDILSANSYHYSLDGSSIGQYSFYLAVGGNSGGRPEKATSLYIANQYQPGIVVPYASTNGQRIKHWYTNDLSLFNYQVLYGTPNLYYQMTYETGNFTYNGYSYHYYVSYFQNEDLPFSPTNTFANWVQNGGSGLFAVLGYAYDSSLINTNVVSYQKVSSNANTIDFSKPYSYSALTDYMSILENTESYPSSSFDYNDAITDTNYPYVFDIDTAISDVVVPFPDTVVVDDSPAIDYPLDDSIDPSLISNNIPIVQGLQNKFPFSIPWDIYRLVNGLSVQRETPSIHQVVEIPIIDYEWEIDLDLSMYDDSAELFRKLFLILFIIGLAVFSYQHFFGS